MLILTDLLGGVACHFQNPEIPLSTASYTTHHNHFGRPQASELILMRKQCQLGNYAVAPYKVTFTLINFLAV